MTSAERDELRALLCFDAPPDQGKDGWLETRAAADYLGVHRDTLRKWAAAGDVPREQAGPGCKLYFQRSALDRWRVAGGRFHAASIGRKSAGTAGDSW